MPSAPKPRPIWENRFLRPTVESLLGEVVKPAAQYASGFREGMLSLEGVAEELAWHGIPWRWSFVFRVEASPVAYLVPSPAKPLVCIPTPPAAIVGLPPKKLAKALREVVTAAPLVGGAHWAQWELSSKSQCDELLAFVQILREAAAMPA